MLCGVMQIKTVCLRKIYEEVCAKTEQLDRQSEQLRARKERHKPVHKTIEHMEMLREQTRGAVKGRGRGCPWRSIVSDAFTVAMMHHAAGPLLSLKLYEASLAHVLLQWRHCLANSSLAAVTAVEGVADKQARREVHQTEEQGRRTSQRGKGRIRRQR